MRMPRKRKARGEGYLEGQLLIAMPIMTDKRFARSVIYMCAHSAEGAMGLIINQRAPHISFRELLKQLGITSGKGEDIQVDPVDDGVSLTATIDILRAIASGKGPDRAILALGYAGWRAGQLESEIAANGWLHCPTDLELLFDSKLEDKYERAMSKMGIDPLHLVSDAGHA
jgi:putative transcriptional regulator